MNSPESLHLLTDEEYRSLVQPMRLDIGSYHSHGPARDCAFIIDRDARPLAAQLVPAAISS